MCGLVLSWGWGWRGACWGCWEQMGLDQCRCQWGRWSCERWGGSSRAMGDSLPRAPQTVEKIRATFTVLRAFGSVPTGHSCNASRFAMVMSLDFNATGKVTAAQLQVSARPTQQRPHTPPRPWNVSKWLWLPRRWSPPPRRTQHPGPSPACLRLGMSRG